MANTARRQREIEHARGDIMSAAARAISRLGLEATTIHDIAREAGYSTTTLYAYFKGKDEIVEALISTMAEELEAAFDAPLPAGLALSQRFEVLILRWAEFGERWREALFAVFMIRDTTQRAAGRRNALLKGDFFLKKLTEWLRRAATSEELGGHDPAAIACILEGTLHGANLLWRQGKYRSSPHECAHLALRIFLDGLTGLANATAVRDGSPNAH